MEHDPEDIWRTTVETARQALAGAKLGAGDIAAIGIAKSDLYPRFSLIGSVGVQAQEIGDLFHTPGSIAAFGGRSAVDAGSGGP